MALQTDRNDQSRSQNTRSIYSLTAVRHQFNLHNTFHNEALRSRLVFSTCFDNVFRGNNGDIRYDAAHVVNAGMRRIERYGRAPDYAGLNGSRQVRMAPD